MEEEKYFSDGSIVEQGPAMIRRKDGTPSNGISIVVACPSDVQAVEVILDYEELKVALTELEADRQAMPHLYV